MLAALEHSSVAEVRNLAAATTAVLSEHRAGREALAEQHALQDRISGLVSEVCALVEGCKYLPKS